MERKKYAVLGMCMFLLAGCTPDGPSRSESPAGPPLVTEENISVSVEESAVQENACEPETDEYRLRSVFLGEGAYSLQDAAVSNEGLIYYCTGRTDEETFGNAAELYQLFPDYAEEGSSQAAVCMTLLSDTLASVTAFDLLPDGGICALVCGDPFERPPEEWDTYYESPENQWALLLYDRSGVLTGTADLTAFWDVPESLFFSGITADAQGRIYLSVLYGDVWQIWVLDESGNLQEQIPAEMFSGISRMSTGPDGALLIFGQNEDYCSLLCELDVQSGSLREIRTFPEGEALVFCPGGEASAACCYADETGVYYEQPDTERVQVLLWEDTGLSGADVYWMEQLDEKRFAVIYTDEAGASVAGLLENIDKDKSESEFFE
ncbi:MAG: hypothetical protein IJ496_01770 [Ruminococcus sp.]|nr:hypothetical protein [Ruminococcus sp.]